MRVATLITAGLFLTSIVTAAGSLAAQTAPAPWFGLTLPDGLAVPSSHASLADGSIAAPEVRVPADEPSAPALAGATIREDLEAIVGFSRRSRERGDRVWGRVSGFRAAEEAIEWAATRFREIGLEKVEVQTFDATAEMWWPFDWEVRLVGDSTFGPGTEDVVLRSALPTGRSFISGDSIVAPLVLVGDGEDGPAFTPDRVRGKVAVQRVAPAAGVYATRGRTVENARSLIGAGAVGVLNVVEQAGNMHVRDFSNCYGPCFNLGTADGAFLIEAMRRAAVSGAGEVRARLELNAANLAGLRAHNAVAILPGEGESDEVVIVNAHIDGWFDAAGDNGDGFAVMLALARHLADPENRPRRTHVFVASAGHHSTGLNGPSNFVRMNPDLARRAVVVLNLEHVAQMRMTSNPWRVDPIEQQMGFGISNEAPFLAEVARRGIERYDFQLRPDFGSAVPGDLGGYAELEAARVQAIHSGPLYHTSGDVIETISTPGLERAARFFAYFLREVDGAPRERILP